MQRDDLTSGLQSAAGDRPDGSQTDQSMPQNLRALRRQWVQDDLARIALHLFLDRGYDAVSVEEVAAAAGMSERTFFRYFPSKEAVLRRYRHSLSARFLRLFEARPSDEFPLVALRGAYLESSHVPESERPKVHALERLLATTTAIWAKDLGETITDTSVVAELARRMNVAASDLRPTVLAAAVSAAAATGWNCWARSTGEDDPSTIVAAAIDLLGLTE
nr:TetR family transcriptional regulator [Rhodococcus wratislaviensis]